jgi:RND family efflux transporter MFP subunit
MKMKYSLISLFFITLVSCSDKQEKQKQNIERVEATVIKPIVYNKNNLKVSGVVKAEEQAVISTRMMSEVKQVMVQAGEQVKQGEELLLLDTQEVRAKVNQAKAMVNETQAALVVAEQDVNRYQELVKSNSVSVKENENVVLHYQSIQAKHQAAKAMLAEAEYWLKHAIIKAPFTGTIAQVLIDAGSITNPGMPLIIMEKGGDFRIQSFVDEETARKVKLNDAVKITAGQQFVDGKVISKATSSSSNSGLYEIEIKANKKSNLTFLLGQTVTVLFITNNDKQAIWIPNDLLIHNDNQMGVFILDSNNQAALRWIKTGLSNDSITQVLSGITAEDKILKSDNRLRNGVKILLKEK